MLRLVKPIIEAVLPAIAGKDNMAQVEQLLVQAVRKIFPDPLSFEVDVGKLIVKGLKDSVQTQKLDKGKKRRLLTGDSSTEGGSWISEDGVFNLGHIPGKKKSTGRGVWCVDE